MGRFVHRAQHVDFASCGQVAEIHFAGQAEPEPAVSVVALAAVERQGRAAFHRCALGGHVLPVGLGVDVPVEQVVGVLRGGVEGHALELLQEVAVEVRRAEVHLEEIVVLRGLGGDGVEIGRVAFGRGGSVDFRSFEHRAIVATLPRSGIKVVGEFGFRCHAGGCGEVGAVTAKIDSLAHFGIVVAAVVDGCGARV